MPAKWAVQGSATDLLVQGVYTLIATTRGSLSSMYPPLVLTLTNTAPVWRGLSVASATRLVQLLNSFSNPAFLLAVSTSVLERSLNEHQTLTRFHVPFDSGRGQPATGVLSLGGLHIRDPLPLRK